MRVLFTMMILLCVVETVFAKDLPEKIKSIDDSVSGTLIERIETQFAKLSNRVVLRDNFLRTALGKVAPEQVRADDAAKVIWKLEDDSDAGKQRFVRERVAGNGFASRFADFKNYAGKRPAYSDSGLVEKGSKLIKELSAQAGLLSAREEFRPDSTVILRHEGGDASGKRESFVIAAEVVMRRYIDGVPVIGPRGEARAMFDADGSLVEVTLPNQAYVQSTPWRPSQSKSTLPTRALSRLGISPTTSDSAPAPAGAAAESKLRQLRCGYVDDESAAELRAGCEVLLTKPDESPAAQVIMLD